MTQGEVLSAALTSNGDTRTEMNSERSNSYKQLSIYSDENGIYVQNKQNRAQSLTSNEIYQCFD